MPISQRVVGEEAKREGALLIIDVDHFKDVNDNFGHESGDEALKIIAQTIKGVVREIDLVGRIGGEEFSVFLPGTDANRTHVIAERIRAAISTVEFYPTGNRCDLSVSVGGATYDREATFSELFRRADLRLYAAKQNGRNRVEIHNTPARGAAPCTWCTDRHRPGFPATWPSREPASEALSATLQVNQTLV